MIRGSVILYCNKFNRSCLNDALAECVIKAWSRCMICYGYLKIIGYPLLSANLLQLSVFLNWNSPIISQWMLQLFFLGWCILISGYWKLAWSTARMTYVRPRHEQQWLKLMANKGHAGLTWRPRSCLAWPMVGHCLLHLVLVALLQLWWEVCKSYSVTLQLDISKALDRVSWVFLLETLQALGFG